MTSSDRFVATPVIREKRRPQVARMQLRDGTGEPIEIIVRDVSARGISAMTRGRVPHEEEVVSIDLPDGREFWGLVRWVKGSRFGVEFDVTS
jgi:hypothetical protein